MFSTLSEGSSRGIKSLGSIALSDISKYITFYAETHKKLGNLTIVQKTVIFQVAKN